MPTISDNAICLRRWDFSETSQTVSLLTRDHGVIRGLAKGAKREKGTFSGGIELLTRGHLIAIVKPGRDLATLTEWHLEETFRVLRERLEANRAAFYLADLVHHMLTHEDPHPPLFDAFIGALRRLERGDPVGPVMLAMQLTVLDETGYAPQLNRDADTGRDLPTDEATLAFSPDAGGVTADTGAGDRWRVRRETVELLRACDTARRGLSAADGNGERTALFDADPQAVDRANRLLATYARHLIGREPAAMRWAFSDVASPDAGT